MTRAHGAGLFVVKWCGGGGQWCAVRRRSAPLRSAGQCPGAGGRILVDRTGEPEPEPDRAIHHGAWRMDDAGAFAWTMEVGGVERVRRVKTP